MYRIVNLETGKFLPLSFNTRTAALNHLDFINADYTVRYSIEEI